MSEVKVRIRYQFAPVPREIAQNPSISANTLAAVTYLCSKGENWSPRVYDIRRRFGWGDRAWRAVSQEMRILKIMGLKKTRNGTELIFDPHGVEEQEEDGKVIHKPPVQNGTVPKPTRAKSTYIDHIDHKLDRSYKDHIDHMNDLKKKMEKGTSKPSMQYREQLLSSDSKYVLEKLKRLKGLYPGMALALVELYSPAEINNVLEMASRQEVRNPGAYVVASLLLRS